MYKWLCGVVVENDSVEREVLGSMINRDLMVVTVVKTTTVKFLCSSVVLYSYNLVNLYMYVFGPTILYEIISKLC